MSTNPESDDAGYRRDNWFGEPDVETAATRHHDHGTDWSREEIVDEKAEAITWMVFSGVAPAMCGVSIDDPAKEATELTEPEVYPHGEGNRQHLRRARINEGEGYITGGESTGVRLGDIPRDDFLDTVEILLAYWNKANHIDEEQVGELMVDAQRMKSNSDIRDKEAIERLVSDVLGQE